MSACPTFGIMTPEEFAKTYPDRSYSQYLRARRLELAGLRLRIQMKHLQGKD